MSTSGRAAAAADDTPLDENERDLWFTWKRAHEVVRARVAEQVHAATGLSDADVAVLIRASGVDGGLRQSQLVSQLGWDRSRVSHQVSRMEARGLLRRRRLDDGVAIELTAAGQDVVDVARPLHAAAVRRHLIEPFTPAQVAHLRDALGRICDPGRS